MITSWVWVLVFEKGRADVMVDFSAVMVVRRILGTKALGWMSVSEIIRG